jgi:hypothetical protein
MQVGQKKAQPTYHERSPIVEFYFHIQNARSPIYQSGDLCNRWWYRSPIEFCSATSNLKGTQCNKISGRPESFIFLTTNTQMTATASTSTQHNFLQIKYELFQCDYIRGSYHHLEKRLLRLPKDVIFSVRKTVSPHSVRETECSK